MNADGLPEAASILQHTPNGVVVVDEEACIRFANPAFRRMFSLEDAELIGWKAEELLGSDFFERAIASGGELTVRGRVPRHDLHYCATIFRVEGENRWSGIFVDTSEEERARAALAQVRSETLARAEQVILRQMQSAQEIAGLLGETTAETKVLLVKLMDLFRRERVG
ncbi:MAG: PAS domain-containing protein [Thermoguttaceae bacterium]|jgi:PAS domain S-box-containing protein